MNQINMLAESLKIHLESLALRSRQHNEEAKVKCLRKTVGCSWGYVTRTGVYNDTYKSFNGPKTSTVGCSNEKGNCGCMHAEVRLVMNLLNEDTHEPSLVVCTYSPCSQCANSLIHFQDLTQSIKGVVYDILTEHDKRGVELLKAAGITVLSLQELMELVRYRQLRTEPGHGFIKDDQLEERYDQVASWWLTA